MCQYYTLTNQTISSSSLTILTITFLTKYIYTILSITHQYIYIIYYYIYTNLQSKYTTILDIYLTYTIITYLLTLKNRTHLSITYFTLQLYLYIPLLTYSIYYIYHYYFIITTSSYCEHTICIYVHIYIYTIISIVFILI